MTNSFIINFENKVIALEKEAREFRQACQDDTVRNDGKQYSENLRSLGALRYQILFLQGELQGIFDETKKEAL